MNDTTLLLGLPGVVVDRVEVDSDGTRVVHVATMDAPRVCPSCGVPSVSVKGWVTTGPRDVPFPVGARLVWRKRRWRCRESACVRSSFTESVPQIPSRKRVTGRLRAAAGGAVADGARTVAQAARDFGLSWPVVHAAFLDHAAAVLPEEPQPVAALGIDETRRGKPRFAVDPETGALEQVTDRWHTGFVDLTGKQGLLGQVEGRSSGDAGSWLAARTQAWRDGVQAVAIDMCSAFRAAVREHLPHATLVVDHFHVVQLANQVVSSVRRKATTKLRGRRVRKEDPEYGLRRRLLRNREDLTPEKFIDMWNRLADLGPAGTEVLTAWIAKEELRTLLALARKGTDRHRISHQLWTFYRWCADTDITELHRLATTIQDWWPQIEAFIHTGITNAASEGINRLIKLEARNAFGFRNATNQRLRSRCATTRAARHQAKPG
ncbi:MAG TPA: ISL3 family transposase [Actinophytocola sp.]|uniref:ISL3 family transposase n=1 Tax=Actinophytocola sp. TaxID=1872138 RepID=UPI002DFD849B|nr:ISL3 family transposase [Actinophytocola sp.]